MWDSGVEVPSWGPAFLYSLRRFLPPMETGPCLASSLGVEFKESALPHYM